MKNGEELPTDKPLLSAYSRVFGQEWFYAAVKTDFLQKIMMVRFQVIKLPRNSQLQDFLIGYCDKTLSYVTMKCLIFVLSLQAFSSSAGKESPVWTMMETLQKGLSWHWTKPFLMFETRYIQATTLGLPLEISKYYSSLTAITLNGEHIIPMIWHMGAELNSITKLSHIC